ncbi:uncharacterized protein LOC142222524 [Haematobia irritans]|uniref:uncharacterized protein LOC142222524 n=1 Tax=Haematobia irritans TaxID=7368 RepID=UPI003F4FC877
MKILFKFIVLLIAVEFVLGQDILLGKQKQRAGCAQVDFNDPTKITYWSPFGGIGPVVGHGIDNNEAKNMLTTALENLQTIDENQYRIDKIITAVKCLFTNGLYEFNVTLTDKNEQIKTCVVQIYKNYGRTEDDAMITTAVVVACDDEPQYVKMYNEVQN